VRRISESVIKGFLDSLVRSLEVEACDHLVEAGVVAN